MGVAREVVQVTLGVATAALVGTMYVLVHEKRRKMKALRRGEAQGGSSPDGQRNSSVVTKEQLIRILEESSAAAYQLIEQACGTPERRSIPCVPCSKYAATWASRALKWRVAQTRKMVYTKHEQTKIPCALPPGSPSPQHTEPDLPIFHLSDGSTLLIVVVARVVHLQSREGRRGVAEGFRASHGDGRLPNPQEPRRHRAANDRCDGGQPGGPCCAECPEHASRGERAL